LPDQVREIKDEVNGLARKLDQMDDRLRNIERNGQ